MYGRLSQLASKYQLNDEKEGGVHVVFIGQTHIALLLLPSTKAPKGCGRVIAATEVSDPFKITNQH